MLIRSAIFLIVLSVVVLPSCNIIPQSQCENVADDVEMKVSVQ